MPMSIYAAVDEYGVVQFSGKKYPESSTHQSPHGRTISEPPLILIGLFRSFTLFGSPQKHGDCVCLQLKKKLT